MHEANTLDIHRIKGLDLLRSIAILLVFFWHNQNNDGAAWLLWIKRYGWAGVDLFFVLSGYLIACQLFKPLRIGNLPSLKIFYLKRTFRILPAYLAVLLIYFIVPAWNEGHGLSPLWKFIIFTENFGLDRSVASGFSHAWSLCVEEHFYLLLPSVVLLCWSMRSKISLKSIAIVLPIFILVAGMVLRLILWLSYIHPIIESPAKIGLVNFYDKIIYYPTYNRLDGILTGVVIALVFTFKPNFKRQLDKYPNLPVICGLGFLVTAGVLTSDRTSLLAAVFGFPALSFGFGGLVASAALPGSILNRLHVPGSTMIATLAYTFYLVHKELMHLFRPLLESYAIFKNELTMAIGLFLISLLGAQILHMLIERPGLLMRDKLLIQIIVKN